MKGQGVCAMHGGKAPAALARAQAVIERADMKILGLAILAVDAIERLLQAESEAVILAAAKDILDRGGLKGCTPDRSGHRDHSHSALVASRRTISELSPPRIEPAVLPR